MVGVPQGHKKGHILWKGTLAEVSFGEWLKRQRKTAGLTQDQLALQISCSTSALKKIEAEERRPSAQIVDRLAEIFDIPPSEQASFLRFARGDWQSAPTRNVENAPWLVSHLRENDSLSNPKTHLATFLFTDIESSAKLWENAPEQMKTALGRHHTILQEAIVSNGGDVFQIVGDAFCAVFPTVPSAVSAASTAQSELYQEEWDLPFPIRVRMGIHTGEAEPTSNDSPTGGYASNQTLNRVARILSAAHGGQVLLSLATKELAKNLLPANMELRDMGEHYLKNLVHPEHLFQLDIAGMPSDFPPLNTLGSARHNLPVQLTNFIGREQEITVVHGYLSKKDIHLVTLIGPAGIGKTRLSIEAVRAELSDFPDGVFFIALAPLGDSSLVAPTIAQTLGFVETKNRSPFERLKDGIGDKQMLIVLDNVEHLVEETATLVSDLLLACPRLKILTTSREALRIPGEWLYSVPTLSIPAETQLQAIDMETVSQYAALTLFAERARAVRSDFALNAENIEAVAMICTQLDGLPLAIELIAARIRLMSPQALLERLSGQFTLYADGMRAVSARQKTLHGAIAWSYDLLSPEEQKLFTHLSVFSGGFTLEKAKSIFSRTIPNKSVSDLMASLLDKSLLQRTLDARGEPRFSMLVTIQQFALDRLRHMDEETEVRNWHLAYFLELAKQADQEIHGPHQVEWLDILEAEHDNYRAVLGWCISSGYTEPALYLIGSFSGPGRLWSVRGYFSEARKWFDKVQLLPDHSRYPLLYATALNGMSFIASLQGDYSSAIHMAEESQSICEPLGSAGEIGLGGALYGIGLAEFWGLGDNRRARDCFERAAAIYRTRGNHWEQALALFRLGVVARDHKNHEQSRSFLEKSLAVFKDLGDAFGLGRVYEMLGYLFSDQGDYGQARAMQEQALLYNRRLHFHFGVLNSLTSLGNIYRIQGDFHQAEVYLGEASRTCREFNMLNDFLLFCLGCVKLHRGNYTDAKTHFIEFIRMNHKQGVLNQVGEGLIGLAAAKAGLHQNEHAARLVGAGQAIHEAITWVMKTSDRIEIDPLLIIAREQLGNAKFDDLMAEGRAMTMEQAIAYALEDQDC